MKILHLSIVVILTASLVIVCNNVFADNSIQHISIDGTVTPTGCHFINGTITQAIDILNSTVQICNYDNKHFKLTDESDCMPFSMEENNCHRAFTCGTNSNYERGVTRGDKIPIYEGSKQYIDIIYPGNMCVSETYNIQEKKITIIANGSDVVDHYPRCCAYVNYSQIDVLIPKGMWENITSTVDGKYPITFGSSSTWLRPNQSDIEIDLPLSFVTKKIEITGDQKIPEFPFATIVFALSVVSTILLYQFKSKIKI